MQRMGQNFKESDSDSFAMLVLESDQRLGDDAHIYYNSLIKQLRADPTHVQHIQDFWGDPITAPGAQSPDGKAVYTQTKPRRKPGHDPGGRVDESGSRHREPHTPAKGVTTYVTGPAALVTDMHHSGNTSLVKITVVTMLVIFTMLLLVYRSVFTVMVLLIMVFIELTAARGIVSFLG